MLVDKGHSLIEDHESSPLDHVAIAKKLAGFLDFSVDAQ